MPYSLWDALIDLAPYETDPHYAVAKRRLAGYARTHSGDALRAETVRIRGAFTAYRKCKAAEVRAERVARLALR